MMVSPPGLFGITHLGNIEKRSNSRVLQWANNAIVPMNDRPRTVTIAVVLLLGTTIAISFSQDGKVWKVVVAEGPVV